MEFTFKKIAVVEYTVVIDADTEEQAKSKLMATPIVEFPLWQNRRWVMTRFLKWWPERKQNG